MDRQESLAIPPRATRAEDFTPRHHHRPELTVREWAVCQTFPNGCGTRKCSRKLALTTCTPIRVLSLCDAQVTRLRRAYSSWKSATKPAEEGAVPAQQDDFLTLHRDLYATHFAEAATATDVQLLGRPGMKTDVEDATSQSLLIKRGARTPWAVQILSAQSAPDFVIEGVRRAKQARHALGERLGSVALQPLSTGEFRGRSFAIWPYHHPVNGGGLSRKAGSLLAQVRVARWLVDSARHSVQEVPTDRVDELYTEPLRFVADGSLFTSSMRAAAGRALARLKDGQLQPKTVVAHNDLWLGNVLLPANRHATRSLPCGFALIDWRGSSCNGYPFADQVRFLGASTLSRLVLRRELGRMCTAVGCQADDVGNYLLTAIGQLGLQRGSFPLERYEDLGVDLHRTLALAS